MPPQEGSEQEADEGVDRGREKPVNVRENRGLLSLFLRRPAPARGPQNSDQQEHRDRPVKPDVAEAAEHVDHKQEDGDGDHHGAETRQPRVPFPGARKAGLPARTWRRRGLLVTSGRDACGRDGAPP